MMYLIIAEKPSVARSIASVLGADEKHNGYLQGRNCCISWCIGHLVELAMPESYNASYAKWRFSDLPIMPQAWNYEVSENTARQFEIVKTLMHDERMTEVICATDAGREGELIFRLIYEKAACTLPVRRLWISSMEESAIREGFRSLKSWTAYDNLYQAALCRAKADWLIGMNATRLYSLLYGPTLHIGRVMTPTLAMITKREAEINEFQSKPFYTVNITIHGLTAQSERFDSKDTAQHLKERCDRDYPEITHIEKKKREEKPPLLYDLTTLQRDANRLFGFTAQQTLDYAQDLYEKKLLTYPRTDSRFLTHDMASVLQGLSDSVCRVLPFSKGMQLPVHTDNVINDKKVSDHHAIIPTESMPNQAAAIEILPTGERDLLYLVSVRLLCALGAPSVILETKVTLRCGNHDFTAKGKRVEQMGWQAVWYCFRGSIGGRLIDAEQKTPSIPDDLEEGLVMPFAPAEICEGKTTPPCRFNEAGILYEMERAGSKDMPADAERKGIGTPATRAAILEKLIDTGLVERKGDKKRKVLVPTKMGIALASVLPDQLLSAQLTADWEQRLKKIEKGEEHPDQFLKDIGSYLTTLVQTARRAENADALFPSSRPKIGTCPRCGAAVTEHKSGFICNNRVCGFALWRDHGFLKNAKKQLTADMVKTLLEKGSVQMTGLYSKKINKTYSASVLLEFNEQGKPILRPVFGEKGHGHD